jgi:hypothetical protein
MVGSILAHVSDFLDAWSDVEIRRTYEAQLLLQIERHSVATDY